MTHSNTSLPTGFGKGAKIRQLKYQQVEAEIRQLAKTLPVGGKLPAERDLAVGYSCNFLTVRKALKKLVDDGTVVRRIGSGTFVARQGESDADLSGHGRTRLGVLVFQDSDPYAYRLIQAIAHAGLEQSLNLRSCWIQDFGDEVLSQAEQFKREGCAALTLPWFPHERIEEVREFLHRCPLPVSLAMPVQDFEKNCFIEPREFGLNAATDEICRYYQALGHQRVAFLGPDSKNDIFLQKVLTSFICYTSRENLPSPCGLVAPGAPAMDQLAERWKSYRGELAVISYDDEHALRFMTAMHKLGFSAPQDYRILGFNDTEGSRYSDPPLSTICQRFDYIGSWLIKSALALAEGKVCQSSKFPRLQLLVRSTCGGYHKIDESFASQFHNLEIVKDGNQHVPESVGSIASEEAPSLKLAEA